MIGDFERFFEGAKTFLTPKLSWAQRNAILERFRILNRPHNSKPCTEVYTLGKWAGIGSPVCRAQVYKIIKRSCRWEYLHSSSAIKSYTCLLSRVVDPHRFHADPHWFNADPHWFNANPDPEFFLVADPDTESGSSSESGSGSSSESRVLMTKNCKKFTSVKLFKNIFWIENSNLLVLRPP